MIVSLGDRATETLYHGLAGRPTRALLPEILRTALRKLDMLNAAIDLKDLRSPPGNRLEALRGTLQGRHSIRINDQWRIVFRWTPNGPAEVRIVDYHS